MSKGLKKFSLTECIVFVFLLVFIAMLLVLLGWGVSTSLKTVDDALYYPLSLPKEKWMFENYSYVLTHFFVTVENASGANIDVYFPEIMANTLVYAVLGAFVAAIVPMITAYMCARFTEYKLSKVLYVVVLVVMMLPLVGTYPAQLKLLKDLRVYDTYIGVLLQKMSFTGVYFLVYFGMVKGIDKGFYEAAYMDGAGEFTVLFRIYFPLLINTFFTVMLLLFIAFWNDYNTPLLYMPGHPTLSYAIFRLTRSTELEFSTLPMRMTAGVIMVIPILILFLIFRDKITGNLTMGGIKG